MEMSTSPALMTAEELIQLPDDGLRYELINGELKTMSPSGHPYGRITARLTGPLVMFVRENNLGEVYGAETGFKLTTGPDTVLAPDIAFVAKDRLAEGARTNAFWPGAPDLAVEVLSPTERPSEVRTKVFRWLELGARQVWVVSPERRDVTIYRSATDVVTFSEHDHLEAADLLPGLRISLETIFKD